MAVERRDGRGLGLKERVVKREEPGAVGGKRELDEVVPGHREGRSGEGFGEPVGEGLGVAAGDSEDGLDFVGSGDEAVEHLTLMIFGKTAEVVSVGKGREGAEQGFDFAAGRGFPEALAAVGEGGGEVAVEPGQVEPAVRDGEGVVEVER